MLTSVSKSASSLVKILTRVTLPLHLLPSAILAEEVDDGSIDIAGLDTPVIKLDHLTQYHQVRSLVSLLCLSFLVSLASLLATGMTQTALINFFVKLSAWFALLLCIRLRVLGVRNLVFVLLLVAIAAFATQTRHSLLDPTALPPFIRQLFQFSFVPLLASFMIRGGHGASLVVGLALLLYVGNYYSSIGREFRVAEEGDHSLFMGGLVAQLYPVCIFRLYQGEVRMFQVLLSKFLTNSELRSKEKTVFISRMSHELRTPLHGLLSTVKLLGQTQLSQEQNILISTAETCGEIVLEVLRKVLDIVKIESGGFEKKLTDFSLFDLVREASESLACLAEGKALELFVWFEPHPQGYDVRGDQTHLKEILLNILDNAFKFTEAGAITIRVQRQNASWETQRSSYLFEIEDTGTGISEENVSLIFAPFKQIHDSENHKVEGSGLGLSLVKKLTEFLGGTIGVRSSPGEGSTFWFRLPLEPLPEDTFRPALFSLPLADTEALNDLALQFGMHAGTVSCVTTPEAFKIGTNATGKAFELLSRYLTHWGANLVSLGTEDLLSSFMEEQGGQGRFIVDDDPGWARKLVNIRGKSNRVVLFSSFSRLSTSLQAFGPDPKSRSPKFTSIGAVATKPLEPLKICESLLFLLGGDDCLIRPGKDKAPSSGERTRRASSKHLPIPRTLAVKEHEIDVLVVEDDAVTQMVMKRLLEKGNVRYFITPSGDAGLEAWKASRASIPLIFMDVEVEGTLDGLQTTTMIRDLEREREREKEKEREKERERERGKPEESSYIVVMTGRAMVSDQEEALARGCDEFLSKPVKVDKLREIIQARAQARRRC